MNVGEFYIWKHTFTSNQSLSVQTQIVLTDDSGIAYVAN